MNKTNVTLALLALTTTILQADIYDTASELDKKYGKAEVDGRTRVYQWKEYRVECTLFQYKPELLLAIGLRPQEEPHCIEEKFTRPDGQPLTMRDFQAILPTSLYGGKWTQRGHNEWRTEFAKARTNSRREIVVRPKLRE
jgi:hypothetical protein